MGLRSIYKEVIGLDTKLYGLHSHKIEDAFAAANNDLPDRPIYQIVLLRSMVGGSPRKLKILTVGRLLNTSS